MEVTDFPITKKGTRGYDFGGLAQMSCMRLFPMSSHRDKAGKKNKNSHTQGGREVLVKRDNNLLKGN